MTSTLNIVKSKHYVLLAFISYEYTTLHIFYKTEDYGITNSPCKSLYTVQKVFILINYKDFYITCGSQLFVFCKKVNFMSSSTLWAGFLVRKIKAN